MDGDSGAVDNNGGKDFRLDLSGAISIEELQERRVAAFEAAEETRKAELAAEEERIYEEWMRAAQGAAEEALQAFRDRKRRALREEAETVVAERRGEPVQELLKMAPKPNTWRWLGGTPDAGSTGVLAYNKASGPLATAAGVMAHVGYDGWWLKDKRVLVMQRLSDAEAKRHKLPAGDWYSCEVPIWSTAVALDMVFTDERRAMWDNNEMRDFHSPISNAATGERLVDLVYEALAAASAEETAHGEVVAAKRVLEKTKMKALAARRRRELQARVVYTKPLTPQAGQPAELYYNPDHTPLRGRPDIYVKGAFNRWQSGAFGPLPMEDTLPGGIGWQKATIQVPADAHILDTVFLDSADQHGGFYDSNKGLDYHIRVANGSGTLKKLRVVHVASEMAPIAKEGGLGDVVTALGRAVQEEGHEVEVVLPKYDCINYNLVQGLHYVKDFYYGETQIKIWKGVVEDLNTTFLEPCNGMFWVGKIYIDIWKDRHRFGFWSGAALDYLQHHADARRPDMIHCHDWQSAPCAWMDRGGATCAFTIHNMNFGADLIGKAMEACDVATTVSPTYAQEISGAPEIAPHHAKFFGIRNGIDPDIWDPAEDAFLPRGYTVESLEAGKAAAKAELRHRMGLSSADVPVVGCVTRLTHQKGIHLIKHAAWRTLERGGQFVLLGSAPDPKVQAEFNELAADLARQYPDRAKLWFAYDEPLSHLIYAGADMFLVPSMFEPCGLTQMIAMRYGTVPVVRRTGGLADTVMDIDHDKERAATLGLEPNGFSFEGADAGGMDYALNRALSTWYGEKDTWNLLARNGMQADWSWSSPALDYLELYYYALKKYH